jgi:hypothetical protein
VFAVLNALGVAFQALADRASFKTLAAGSHFACWCCRND